MITASREKDGGLEGKSIRVHKDLNTATVTMILKEEEVEYLSSGIMKERKTRGGSGSDGKEEGGDNR